jgi:hypothetical protein
MGFNLYKNYRNTDYKIYYHHGKDKEKEPNFCEPTPFFDKCSNASKLSYVDIAVINGSDRAILVCEIEEGGAEPKKIIGDIINIVLSDQIRIQGRDYYYDDNIVFILGTNVNPIGAGEEKTQNICQKLRQINEKVGNKKIELILVFNADVKELTKDVEEKIVGKLDRRNDLKA